MLFNSYEFIVFFFFVTVIYFLLPHRFRWFHLLSASCLFYMAFIPIYILILFFTIIIDYIAGIVIEDAVGARRKWFLVMSIVANVGVLAFFKYYNFFAGNINELFHITNVGAQVPLLGIILPIGLSFHTFQAMSYTIEVYRGKHKAERHFGIYALYVMFYPQLVAGPIERPQNILYQFYQHKKFDYDQVTNGLKLMLWGMFKKVVIADRLSVITDQVYTYPHGQSALTTLLAVIFFSFQIFCDFSGYTDIARGAAEVMGFRLMQNFNRPYSSKTISEFWSRWHISLSTWFKDYVYISLGGNRVSVPRWYFNLFIVFLLSGFWHGANWTFLVWGALHGFYLIFAIITQKPREKFNQLIGLSRFKALDNIFRKLTTFVLVAFAWIFFRATSLANASDIIKQLPKAFTDIKNVILRHGALPFTADMKTKIGYAVFLIAFLELVHYMERNNNILSLVNNKPRLVRWFIYYTILLMIIFLGVFQQRTFIYFQF